MDRKFRERDVIRAIFETSENPELYGEMYLTNPYFKQSVDLMVRTFVPAMLHGIQDQARKAEERVGEALEANLRARGKSVAGSMRDLQLDPRYIATFGHEEDDL